MDKVVLFGAGASYGCGHVLPDRPPLGKSLFGELERHFSGSWGSLPSEVRSTFQNDGFESGMRILWEKHSTSIAALMRHMALHLVQYRPDGSGQNLYSLFVSKLKQRGLADRILYSTLNYECLLELAVTSSLKIGYWESELCSDVAVIWKLHGSCNFLSNGIEASSGISFTAGIKFEAGLRAVEPNAAVAYCLGDTGLYPAMALYMQAKPIQVGQGVLHSLQEQWGKAVRSASRILVVGVHPYPDDAHIWCPLAETDGVLAYVGSSEAFSEWVKDRRRSRPVRFLGSKWNECIDDSVRFISEA